MDPYLGLAELVSEASSPYYCCHFSPLAPEAVLNQLRRDFQTAALFLALSLLGCNQGLPRRDDDAGELDGGGRIDAGSQDAKGTSPDAGSLGAGDAGELETDCLYDSDGGGWLPRRRSGVQKHSGFADGHYIKTHLLER